MWYQLNCRDYVMLFWISTKTLHFSNHCAVVKTRERHNLPTTSLKTMKSKFIKQRITDFLGDSLQIFAMLRYSGLHHRLFVVFDCRRLMWITGDRVWLHLNSFEALFIFYKYRQRYLSQSGPDWTQMANPTKTPQHHAPLAQAPLGEPEQRWMQLTADSAADKSRKPPITLNIK